MNNDLISREALKKTFEDTVCIEPMPYAFVKQIIDNAPTVEERPHGKWIKKVDDVGFVSYICSECGFELELEDCSDSYYCTNCGADMRGDDNAR